MPARELFYGEVRIRSILAIDGQVKFEMGDGTWLLLGAPEAMTLADEVTRVAEPLMKQAAS